MSTIVMQINPFDFFTDTHGDALDAGYVWIGQPNLDPRQYPVSVFYDAALTIPAPMPLRTSSGYIVRNGAPTFLYINGNYSVLVQDKQQRQVYYVADFLLTGASGAVSLSDLANNTDPLKGAGLVGFKRSKLAQTVAGVGRMLSSTMINLWEYESFVVTKPNPADSDTWDWTPAIVAGSADSVVYNSPLILPIGKFNVAPNTWTMFRTGEGATTLDRQSTGIIGMGAGSRIIITGTGTGLTIGQSGEGGTVSAGRNIQLENFCMEFSADNTIGIYCRTATQVWMDKLVVLGNSFRNCTALHIRDVIMLNVNRMYIRDLAGDNGTCVYLENPNALTTGNYTFTNILGLVVNKGIWAPASGRGPGQVLNNIHCDNFKVYNDTGTIGTGAGGYTDDGTYFTQRIGFDFNERVYNVVMKNCHVEFKSGETGIRLNRVKDFDLSNNILSGQSAGSMRHTITLVDSVTFPGVENCSIDLNYLQAAATGIYVGKNSTGVSIGNNKTNLVTTYIVRDAALANGEGLADNEKSSAWTPFITGSTGAGVGTYTVQNGVVSRHNNIVTITAQLSWSAHTGTGFLQIDGLPYVTYAGIPHACTVLSSNVAFTGQLSGLTAPGLARILPQRVTTAAPLTQLNMSASGTIYVSATYPMD